MIWSRPRRRLARQELVGADALMRHRCGGPERIFGYMVADVVAYDIRWIERQLLLHGPAAVSRDLAVQAATSGP